PDGSAPEHRVLDLLAVERLGREHGDESITPRQVLGSERDALPDEHGLLLAVEREAATVLGGRQVPDDRAVAALGVHRQVAQSAEGRGLEAELPARRPRALDRAVTTVDRELRCRVAEAACRERVVLERAGRRQAN